MKKQSLKNVLSILPSNLVIAHRGTTYWAPEETEAAMRWARIIGADYLEFDLQRTKDGILVAMHDVSLQRTTDVAVKFPERKEATIAEFTYAELLTLDLGSWFNTAFPERARKEFVGLDILTLEDIIQIAEGKRLKRDENGKKVITRTLSNQVISTYEDDPADNGNRPGIYPETKSPNLYPGIERALEAELTTLGWYDLEVANLIKIPCMPNKVGVANTPARVILQTFSKASLQNLNRAFPRLIPTCFLLWKGTDPDDLKDDSDSTFQKAIDFAKDNGACIIGPSIGGEPNKYSDLLTPRNARLIKKAGLLIHAYSFDTDAQMLEYLSFTPENKKDKPFCRFDAMFTNRADLSILFYQKHFNKTYKRKFPVDAEGTLTGLGYRK